MDNKLVLVFEEEKPTKRTVRFQEVHDEHEDAMIGPLYVQKHALKLIGNPKKLRVTVEPVG